MKRGAWMLIVALGAGCTAAPPEGNFVPQNPNKSSENPAPERDPNANPEPPAPVLPPTLAPRSSSVYWDTTPVSGTGPAGGLVIINTEAEGPVTAPVDARGNWCRDVALKPEQVNKFSARAQSAQGELSDAVDFTISQHGVPPPADQPKPSYNAAKGSSVSYTSGYCTLGWPNWTGFCMAEGSADDIADGNKGTMASFRYDTAWPYGDPGPIWLKFPTSHHKVNKIIVRSNPDCALKKFKIWVADKATVGSPSAADPDWEEVVLPSGASGSGTDEVAFATKAMSHIAIEATDAACTSWGWEYVDLFEVEAWTESYQAPPAPEAEHCPR